MSPRSLWRQFWDVFQANCQIRRDGISENNEYMINSARLEMAAPGNSKAC